MQIGRRPSIFNFLLVALLLAVLGGGERASAQYAVDINRDGIVDGEDLAALLGHWGTNNAAADLNNDGSVDSSDLSLVLGSWGSYSLPPVPNFAANIPIPGPPTYALTCPEIGLPGHQTTRACPNHPTPTVVPGHLSWTFVNDTGLPPEQVFLVFLFTSQQPGAAAGPAYLNFTPTSKIQQAIGSVAELPKNTYLSTITSKLSEFQMTATNEYTIYIPSDGASGSNPGNWMGSARLFISLWEPLNFWIDNTSTIQEQDYWNRGKEAYYIIHDKVEFNIGDLNANRLNINLTQVDFAGIPMFLEANYQCLNGTDWLPACAQTGALVSLDRVFKSYTNYVNTLSTTDKESWGSLMCTSAGSSAGTVTPLRIMSPTSAIKSQDAANSNTPTTFPVDYFTNGCWFEKVYYNSSGNAFYQQNQLNLAFPAEAGDYIAAQGQVDAHGAFNFSFQCSLPNGCPAIDGHPPYLSIQRPLTSQFIFDGAPGSTPYNTNLPTNPQDGSPNDAVKVVFKYLSAAVISGALPAECPTPGPNQPPCLGKDYLRSQSGKYFQNNSALDPLIGSCSPSGRLTPWYDFYSRAMSTISAPYVAYASAFSDVLDLDGTIAIIFDTNCPSTTPGCSPSGTGNRNPNASLRLTLGNVTNTTYQYPPQHKGDSSSYQFQLNCPPCCDCSYSKTDPTGPKFLPADWKTFPSTQITANGNSLWIRVKYGSGPYACTPTNQAGGYISQVVPNLVPATPSQPGLGIFIPELPNQGTLNVPQNSPPGTPWTVAPGGCGNGTCP